MIEDAHGGTVLCAAAAFAPNSYARLRLIRQMHACGLLSAARDLPGDEIDETAPARPELADGSAGASC